MQKDLDLIEVVDDSDVEALEVVDDDTEPIKKDDILKLIDELGIRKERPAFAWVSALGGHESKLKCKLLLLLSKCDFISACGESWMFFRQENQSCLFSRFI